MFDHDQQQNMTSYITVYIYYLQIMAQCRLSIESSESLYKIKPICLYDSIEKDPDKNTFRNTYKSNKSNDTFTDQYFCTNKFEPKIPHKQLINAPKILFSIQRKKYRVNTEIEFNQQSPLKTLKQYVKREKKNKGERKIYTSSNKTQIKMNSTWQWNLVPSLPLKHKAQHPKFMFNLHHMIKEKGESIYLKSFNKRFPKGFQTKYYGSSLIQSQRRRHLKSSHISIDRNEGCKKIDEKIKLIIESRNTTEPLSDL